MRTVIGEYETEAAAEAAVRALELQISIQNIVIGDQRDRKWPRRDLKRDRSRDREKHPNFIVSMSGTSEGVEQARALLRAQATS
jgi:hypothetical protein